MSKKQIDINDVAQDIHDFRLRLLANVYSRGLSAVAEQHFALALNALETAVHQAELASVHQAQALASR